MPNQIARSQDQLRDAIAEAIEDIEELAADFPVFDLIPASRLNLVTLMTLEPEGSGITFEEGDDVGTFSSSADFRKRHGFDFEITDRDYSLASLEEWFFIGIARRWKRMFLKWQIDGSAIADPSSYRGAAFCELPPRVSLIQHQGVPTGDVTAMPAPP